MRRNATICGLVLKLLISLGKTKDLEVHDF